MNKLFSLYFFIVSLLLASNTRADIHAFSLRESSQKKVIDLLHANYGNQIKVDLVQGKLVVVGNKQQIDEINKLLTDLDSALTQPSLHLQLRENPPQSEHSNAIT